MVFSLIFFLLRTLKLGYNFLVFFAVCRYDSKNNKNSISNFNVLATKTIRLKTTIKALADRPIVDYGGYSIAVSTSGCGPDGEGSIPSSHPYKKHRPLPVFFICDGYEDERNL